MRGKDEKYIQIICIHKRKSTDKLLKLIKHLEKSYTINIGNTSAFQKIIRFALYIIHISTRKQFKIVYAYISDQYIYNF